jgi:2-dehydro-3-deoxyphosphogluconate aldolase / (4S)-4-hydroxy-2-oxoglutarate aldolase
MTSTILDKMAKAPIVPTVFPISGDILCEYIQVLYEEKYPALEILSRPLEQALAAVKEINRRPERQLIHLGIGTILTEKAAQMAAELKPDFLVSPAFSRKVLQVAVKAHIPYIPAVRTFQDVQNVLEAFEEEGLDLKVLKLCPVEGLTPRYVNMLGGCFPGIVYCPTGEIDLDNYLTWKASPFIAAPMGSGFVRLEDLKKRDFEKVRQSLKDIAKLNQ